MSHLMEAPKPAEAAAAAAAAAPMTAGVKRTRAEMEEDDDVVETADPFGGLDLYPSGLRSRTAVSEWNGHKGRQLRIERTTFNAPHGDPTPTIETVWEWSCCGENVVTASNVCKGRR
ncbi:hypothetical protein B0T22DRAFT_440294 [Podospora appendiculata]|uniref:Uncharacterized protein n=1 Tax=Podospora appendiculata TaxID=314037 RepID=A0AAE0XAC7_9PEZI|nr:hypothetical protein B0T22DRAFT_440294 [Podospora appendiculata]